MLALLRLFASFGLLAFAFLPGCVMGPPPGAVELPASCNPPPRGHPLTLDRVVRFEHRQVNRSDQPADIELLIAIPRSNERQQVRLCIPSPGPAEEIVDDYGNRILHYVDRAVPPGEVVAHGWIAEVSVRDYVHDGIAGRKGESLTPKRKKVYLRDGENYAIHDASVQSLAKQMRAPSGKEEDTMRAFFDYIINNLSYHRDDVWDSAPVVLKRKSGSCSEYNYVFVSLCRAAGIPARYTGGLVLSPSRVTKYDPRTTEDAVFHRWNEVYLPGRGWFPVDCSRASGQIKRFGSPENYFGRLPAGLLQTMRGDGLGNAPLGWDYLSNQKLPYEEKVDQSAKAAFWIEGIGTGELAARSEVVKDLLAKPRSETALRAIVQDPLSRETLLLHRDSLAPEDLPRLAAALCEVGHPGAIYWSLLAEHRGTAVPAKLRYQQLCDARLLKQLDAQYRPDGDKRDLLRLEYWWRKARPLIRFDRDKGVFVLTAKKVNVY